MKITKTYNWDRRDFYFDAQCEHCNSITKNNSGYDDDNYYRNVVPNMECKQCKQSSNDLSIPLEPVQTRYSPNIVM